MENLFAIARNSRVIFKGRAVDVKQVGTLLAPRTLPLTSGATTCRAEAVLCIDERRRFGHAGPCTHIASVLGIVGLLVALLLLLLIGLN